MMVIEANYVDGGGTANALRMTAAQWTALQDSYCVGDLVMPCCSAPAVPKLSANGRPFFAHASGSCSTSEESLWHMTAKTLVRSVLENLGCQAFEEKPGEHGTNKWQADVWAERGPVKLAVEIQSSYQSLRTYRARQEKYQAAGIQALWLLRSDRYMTLTKSMAKERLRVEFGGQFPAEGHFWPCVSDIPIARLGLDPELIVSGAGFFSATVPDLLEAVLTGRFLCVDGLWCIDNLDAMHQAAKMARDCTADRSR